MNEKIYLKLNRTQMNYHVASERFGGAIQDYMFRYNALEEITGSYQIGNSKGNIHIVWQPETKKFFKMDVISNTSVLDTLLGYVARFGGQGRRSQPQSNAEYEQSQSAEPIEVLKAICMDYLHIPITTQVQDQLKGDRNLESITGRESREISGRDIRQIGSGDVKRLKT